MPTLRINRFPEYANRFRKIKIIMDGNEVMELKHGESKEIPISEGPHALMAKIDYCVCPIVNFIATGDKKKTFKLTSFAQHNPFGLWAALYYSIFKTGKYLRLTPED